MWVADIGGEEFKEAIGGALADGGDEGRSFRSGDDEGAGHFAAYPIHFRGKSP